MNSVLRFIATSLIAAVSLFWRSVVAHCLWVWFITPAFGIVSPGPLLLTGICLIALLATFHAEYLTWDTDNFKREMVNNTVTSFIYPLYAITYGYAIHLCL